MTPLIDRMEGIVSRAAGCLLVAGLCALALFLGAVIVNGCGAAP